MATDPFLSPQPSAVGVAIAKLGFPGPDSQSPSEEL